MKKLFTILLLACTCVAFSQVTTVYNTFDATTGAFGKKLSVTSIPVPNTLKGYFTGYGTFGSFYDSARLAFSLTTTGTSGSATYNSSTGVFNIPQYSGGTTYTGTANRITVTGSVLDIGTDVVTLTGTQTLLNKLLTSPLLNSSSTVGYVWTATNTAGAGAWAAPSGGGGGGVTSGTYATMTAISAPTDGQQFSCTDYLPGGYQWSSFDSAWRYLTAPDITTYPADTRGTITTSGSGADGSNTNGFSLEGSRYGYYRYFKTGTATTGSVAFNLPAPFGGAFLMNSSATVSFAAAVRVKAGLGQLSNSTDRFIAYVGRGITSSVTGIFFRYSDDLSSGNWEAVTDNGGTETVTNTGIAANTNLHDFTITIKTKIVSGIWTDSVRYYIDKTLVATHTTNVSHTASSANVFDGLAIKKSLGTTSVNLYFSALQLWVYKKD